MWNPAYSPTLKRLLRKASSSLPCSFRTWLILRSTDVIWVYSNSSTLAHTDNNFTPVFYNTNIVSASNLTQPNEMGLKGVLYNQDTTDCGSEPLRDYSLPSALPRIALVNQRNDNHCNATLVDSIIKAQVQGAIGAVVYGPDILQNNAEQQSLMVQCFQIIFKVSPEYSAIYKRLLDCTWKLRRKC